MTLTPAERSRKWRLEHIAKCVECGVIRMIKGRGLCATCYNREWRKTAKAKETIQRSNARRNPLRNGRWGRNLHHYLQSLPCTICGWIEATRDVHHIIPSSQEGDNTEGNLITLCPNHHRMADEGILTKEYLKGLIANRVIGKLGEGPARGEKHPHAKLTADEVQEIRYLVKAGATHKDVAGRYGVARNTITDIINRTNWKHLE